jgi:paraquat-inducible protein B
MAAARPAAVGGFVLGGLAIIVAAILFFGGGDIFAPKTKAVVYFQDSVGGLVVGAPVTFRGVRVGSVKRVALLVDASDLTARIPVYLELEPDQVTLVSGMPHRSILPQLIKAGLRAKLVSQSLVTGQMLIELDLSPATPAHFVGPPGQDVPEIPAMESDLEELRQQITQAPIAETIAQALRTLVTVEKVANRLDEEIGPLAADARDVLARAGRTMDTATTTMERVGPEASAVLEEAHELGVDGRRQLALRGDQLGRTLASTDQTLQAARGLVVSINGLVAPHTQSRDELEAMLRDLADSAGSLRDFSRSIERDPSLLLNGRSR